MWRTDNRLEWFCLVSRCLVAIPRRRFVDARWRIVSCYGYFVAIPKNQIEISVCLLKLSQWMDRLEYLYGGEAQLTIYVSRFKCIIICSMSRTVFPLMSHTKVVRGTTLLENKPLCRDFTQHCARRACLINFTKSTNQNQMSLNGKLKQIQNQNAAARIWSPFRSISVDYASKLFVVGFKQLIIPN